MFQMYNVLISSHRSNLERAELAMLNLTKFFLNQTSLFLHHKLSEVEMGSFLGSMQDAQDAIISFSESNVE